ncbi:MAG: 1-deoxy-D-xylulose-5-phosphate reductoisomerase [Treponemataceae bacterium]|nr:1-deoxy-D-xylulose-5-phosphate reductoisomerase [Treponemataceae bacterium]
MKKVLVLGCTGSIGTNTLGIIRNMPEDFSVCGLSAHKKKESLGFLCAEFRCPGVLTSEAGTDGIEKLIADTKPDIVVNGIAGAAGLIPSKLAADAGVDLALANKETVVMAWRQIRDAAEETGCRIIPVDSEHSALFHLLRQTGADAVDTLLITASGGPFRTLTSAELENVTVEQALQHPTWNMGRKITVDSATLANKGLEVIEAVRLFNVPAERVQVVVHPQSLIHSLVRTKDGMLYAQISDPDMKHPILSALTWPEVRANYLQPFELFDATMTFFRPRMRDFPMLEYAFEAARKEKSYTIAYNAANEVAVHAFLEHKISFNVISRIVRTVLDKDWTDVPRTLDDVFAQDEKARRLAAELI